MRHTVGVQSIGVSVVESLAGAESSGSAVAVAEVISALDLSKVSSLVEGGGGLVLGVARAGKSRESAVVQGAVDDDGQRGDGVGQDVALAVAVDVSAVVVRGTAGGAAALGGDLGEGGGDGAAGAGRGGLEVLGELAGRARGSGRRGSEGEAAAVGEGSAGRSAAGAGAVGLEGSTLAEVTADLGGLGTVDAGADLVAQVGQSASELGRVSLSVGDGTLGEDIEGTTGAQVVSGAEVEGDFDSLTSSEVLESILAEAAGQGAEANTLEADTVLWMVLVMDCRDQNGGLTSRVDLSLLNRGRVQEGTGLVELEGRGTGVGDGSLDLGVADHLKLDIQGRVALVQVEGDSADRGGQGGNGKTSEELHLGRWMSD